VSELAGELAVAGEALHGLRWGVELLSTNGFRHDDPPEELSSIARQLLFDLTAGMLSQPRFREEVTPAGTRPADTGWPAHDEQLLTLMAAVLEGRPALCRTFWSDPDFLADGSLSSMLLNARYPLHAEALPTLLAALCADADSASRAWAFAHSLQRVCHRLPRQLDLKSCGLSLGADQRLYTEVRRLHTHLAAAPVATASVRSVGGEPSVLHSHCREGGRCSLVPPRRSPCDFSCSCTMPACQPRATRRSLKRLSARPH
jgi:hypothetical protein